MLQGTLWTPELNREQITQPKMGNKASLPKPVVLTPTSHTMLYFFIISYRHFIYYFYIYIYTDMDTYTDIYIYIYMYRYTIILSLNINSRRAKIMFYIKNAYNSF